MNRLLIGATDKTVRLLDLMHEDFERGFTLIDPEGDVADIVADRIPVELTEHTAYLDAGDTAHPFGLNVLDGVLEDDRYKVAKEFCAFFDVIFPEGPTTLTHARSNYLLLNSLLLLMAAPRPNLLSLGKLLSDSAYRTRCLRHCTDPIVLQFWRYEFPAWKPDDVLPLKSKLGDLLASPVVRNILCQEHSTFAPGHGTITIVNLNRRVVGDTTAFLLGSLLLARSAGPVHVPSFGFLATDVLAGLMSQRRFTLAVSFLDELPRKLRQEVLGTSEIEAEQVSYEDAEALAFRLGVMNPRTLVENAPIDRAVLPPSMKRLRPIRRRSRACHTRRRAQVEREIVSRLQNRVAKGRKRANSSRWE